MNDIFFRRTIYNLDTFRTYKSLQTNIYQSLVSLKTLNDNITKSKSLANYHLQDYVKSFEYENEVKSKLLKYCRDFHNNRGDLSKKYSKVKHFMPKELKDLFSKYFDYKERYESQKSKLRTTYHKVYFSEKKYILDTIIHNNDFLKSTEMINKNITPKLLKVSKKSPENHNKSDRKIDSFIYKYFTRISLKPSPFGLLASTGVNNNEKRQAQSFMKLNITILLNILEYIKLHKSIILKSKLVLNDTVIEKDNRYYFTTFTSKGDNSLYKNSQSLIVINKNNITEFLVHYFKKNKIVTGEKLMKDMPSFLNLNYLYKLVKSHFLVVRAQKMTNNKTFTENIIDYIEEQNILEAEIINKLKRIKEIEKDPFSWDNFEELKSIGLSLCEDFNIRNVSPQNIVYIDTIDNSLYTHTLGAFNAIENNKSRLEELSDFIGIFDISFRNKKLAKEYLDNYYNGKFLPRTAKDLSRFLRELADLLFIKDDYWLEAFGYLKGSYENNIDLSLYNIKYKIFYEMKKQMEQNEKNIIFTKDFTNKIRNEKRKILGNTHNSRAFFIQQEKDTLILNHIYKGYGVYNRRFKNYLNSTKRDFYKLDGLLLDIPLTFGFNANIRRNTDYVLKLPIEEHILKYKNEVDWLSLGFKSASHNEEITIINTQNGEKIYPNFLGSLITTALPSLVAIFNTITLNDSLYFNVGDLLVREIIKNRELHLEKKPILFPRVYFQNENLLMSRKKWFINLNLIKENLQLEELDLWVSIQHFFNLYDLPNEFYLKDIFIKYEVDSDLIKDKPQYIDINSPLSFKEFKKIIKDKKYIIIEECIPDTNNLESDVKNIEEYIYETTD